MSCGLKTNETKLNTEERATIVNFDSETESDSMPPRRRRTRRKSSRKPRRGLKGIRITKGKIALRVTGYTGLQRIGASEIIHYIPLAKLKAAARRVLRRAGATKTKRRKRVKRVKRRRSTRRKRRTRR